MDIGEALEFVRSHPRAVLVTRRRDGRPQTSPVTVGVADDGVLVISSRETAMKVRNLRRDPRATLCVFTERFYGPWHYVEGEAQLVPLPDAMEGLVDYYRRAAGEHSDWDDYRAAMVRDQRLLIRIDIQRSGPTVSG